MLTFYFHDWERRTKHNPQQRRINKEANEEITTPHHTPTDISISIVTLLIYNVYIHTYVLAFLLAGL